MADTNKNGTSASLASALARCVLPVPGGPSNNTPRRGRPPISLRNFSWLSITLKVWLTSSTTRPSPTTSENPTSICSGRNVTCGDRLLLIIGRTSTSPSKTTMAIPGNQNAASSLISGIPGNGGRPRRNLDQNQTANRANTAARRHSRFRRPRSRFIETVLIALGVSMVYAFRRGVGHALRSIVATVRGQRSAASHVTLPPYRDLMVMPILRPMGEESFAKAWRLPGLLWPVCSLSASRRRASLAVRAVGPVGVRA